MYRSPAERFDERDTMFARMARVEGTPQYRDYYSSHVELEGIDSKLRSMAQLNKPGGIYYNEHICSETEDLYQAIYSIDIEQEQCSEWTERLKNSKNITSELKSMAKRMGAVDVGIAPVDEAIMYSFKGRLDEDYGREIKADLPFSIVFLVEMDHEVMKYAPRAEAARESARCYYEAAIIAKTFEKALAEAGWTAKAHYDAHYEMILPPLAILAGLGELGRNNILISKKYGSRVRIGAVTTDCKLIPDSPASIGARNFCGICRKCSENCPSKALSNNLSVTIRGISKWPTDIVRCYRFWRVSGTDCGVCMAVCPFSHKNSLFHNFVRWIVKNFKFSHKPALFFDDLIYGRKWRAKGGGIREALAHLRK